MIIFTTIGVYYFIGVVVATFALWKDSKGQDILVRDVLGYCVVLAWLWPLFLVETVLPSIAEILGRVMAIRVIKRKR